MGTVRPGPVLLRPTLLAKLVEETLDKEELVRSRGEETSVVDRAVWNEVDPSLSGERALAGEVGDPVVRGGERCERRRVEFEAVDRTDDAEERTDETEGAIDLGLPNGGVGLGNKLPGTFGAVDLLDAEVRELGPLTEGFGDDFVTMDGAEGRRLVLRTDETDGAREFRLEASESRGVMSSASAGEVLTALRFSTLARSEAATMDSLSLAVRIVDEESVRVAVLRLGVVFAAVSGTRRSSTGTSSSNRMVK